MKKLTLTTLLALVACLSWAQLPAQELTLDAAKPDKTFKLTLEEGSTQDIHVFLKNDGAAYDCTNTYDASLYWTDGAANSEYLVEILGAWTASNLFTLSPTALNTSTPGKFFAQVIITDGSDYLEWSRGTLILEDSPFASTNVLATVAPGAIPFLPRDGSLPMTGHLDADGNAVSNGVFYGDGAGLTNIALSGAAVFGGAGTTGLVTSTAADTNNVLQGDGTWVAQSGGGGSGSVSTIKTNGTQIGDADIEALDFSSEFTATESPDTEVNVAIAASITRDTELTAHAASNDVDIAAIEDELQDHEDDIATNAVDIATNAADIVTAEADISSLQSDLAGLAPSNLVQQGASSSEVIKWDGSKWAPAADATGSGGSPVILDLGDDGSNESTDLQEIAVDDDTAGIFLLSAADKLSIDVAAAWPTADDANSLGGTAAADWATDAEVATAVGDYLPLAGGIMAGTLQFGAGVALRGSAANFYIVPQQSGVPYIYSKAGLQIAIDQDDNDTTRTYDIVKHTAAAAAAEADRLWRVAEAGTNTSYQTTVVTNGDLKVYGAVDADDWSDATALTGAGALDTGAAVADTAFSDLTAGSGYANFGDAADDTLDELLEAIDDSWPSGSGAPTDAEYWVGTADATLSAEIVVNDESSLYGALSDVSDFVQGDEANSIDSGMYVDGSIDDVHLATDYYEVAGDTLTGDLDMDDNSLRNERLNITVASSSDQPTESGEFVWFTAASCTYTVLASPATGDYGHTGVRDADVTLDIDPDGGTIWCADQGSAEGSDETVTVTGGVAVLWYDGSYWMLDHANHDGDGS